MKEKSQYAYGNAQKGIGENLKVGVSVAEKIVSPVVQDLAPIITRRVRDRFDVRRRTK